MRAVSDSFASFRAPFDHNYENDEVESFKRPLVPRTNPDARRRPYYYNELIASPLLLERSDEDAQSDASKGESRASESIARTASHESVGMGAGSNAKLTLCGSGASLESVV